MRELGFMENLLELNSPPDTARAGYFPNPSAALVGFNYLLRVSQLSIALHGPALRLGCPLERKMDHSEKLTVVPHPKP